jgi:hypothetical protein
LFKCWMHEHLNAWMLINYVIHLAGFCCPICGWKKSTKIMENE